MSILGIMVHVIASYLLVYYYGLGMVGTGLAGTVTNSFMLAASVYQTRNEPELKEANDVSIWDTEIYTVK